MNLATPHMSTTTMVRFEFKGCEYILYTKIDAVWKILDVQGMTGKWDAGFNERERIAIKIWGEHGGFGGLTLEQFLYNIQV